MTDEHDAECELVEGCASCRCVSRAQARRHLRDEEKTQRLWRNEFKRRRGRTEAGEQLEFET